MSPGVSSASDAAENRQRHSEWPALSVTRAGHKHQARGSEIASLSVCHVHCDLMSSLRTHQTSLSVKVTKKGTKIA